MAKRVKQRSPNTTGKMTRGKITVGFYAGRNKAGKKRIFVGFFNPRKK